MSKPPFTGKLLNLQRRITLGVLVAHALAFLLVVAIIIWEVLIRYLGYAAVLSVEISGYMMASIVSWSACYALFEKAHVRIDILYQKRRPLTKSALDAVAIVSFACVAGVLAWSTLGLTLASWEFNDVSSSILRIPLWIPQILWALGFFWLALCCLTLTVTVLFALKPHNRETVSSLAGASDETFV